MEVLRVFVHNQVPVVKNDWPIVVAYLRKRFYACKLALNVRVSVASVSNNGNVGVNNNASLTIHRRSATVARAWPVESP